MRLAELLARDKNRKENTFLQLYDKLQRKKSSYFRIYENIFTFFGRTMKGQGTRLLEEEQGRKVRRKELGMRRRMVEGLGMRTRTVEGRGMRRKMGAAVI